jgi:hypothetical protein
VEYWDDKALTGGHWTGEIRVSLPFNLGNIFAGRNLFEGASEAFGPPSGDFGDRMSDLVIRSHRVKTTTSGYVQTEIQPAQSVSSLQEVGRIVIPNVGEDFDDDSDVGGAVISVGGFEATTSN